MTLTQPWALNFHDLHLIQCNVTDYYIIKSPFSWIMMKILDVNGVYKNVTIKLFVFQHRD